jgi:hypothetical protein
MLEWRRTAQSNISLCFALAGKKGRTQPTTSHSAVRNSLDDGTKIETRLSEDGVKHFGDSFYGILRRYKLDNFLLNRIST